MLENITLSFGLISWINNSSVEPSYVEQYPHKEFPLLGILWFLGVLEI
jgi:hypothetical protein